MKLETGINYLLILLIMLTGLSVLVSLLRHKEQNLLELIKGSGAKLARRLPLVILSVAVFFAAYLFGQMKNEGNSASVTLGFNYSKASSGLNPNNTRFNSTEIISEEVLNTAIANGGYTGIDAADLREAMHISPVVVGDELSLDKFYISTEYQLKYDETDKTQSLDPKDVLIQVTSAYYDKFVRDYSRKTSILEVDFTNMEDSEYLDMKEYLDEKSYEIQQYMTTMSMENSTFLSSESGETFGSLAGKVQDYRDIELERFNALVLENGLVKDSSQFTSRLNYDNRILNISFMKNLAAYKVRLDAIDKYERDLASIVLVPTQDATGEFYMSRTKLGVDDFAAEAEGFKTTATNRRLLIDTNNYSITKILNSEAGSDVYAHADQMLTTLQDELKRLADHAVQIVEEYNSKTTNNYMNIIFPELSFVQKYKLKNGILLTGVFAAVFALFMIVTPAKSRRRSRKRFVAKEN